MNRKFRTFLWGSGAAAILGLLLSAGPALHAQNQARVLVRDAAASPNQVTQVAIALENGPDEGLTDFDGTVEYDPAVANVTGVEGANGYNIAAFRIDNDNGLVRFIGFKISGELLTEGAFVRLNVRARGDVGSSTNLSLSLRTFSTEQGSINHEVRSGTFRIREEVAALTADFSVEPTNPSVGEAVQFTDQSSGGLDIVNWRWDFDDGSTSSRQSPSHTYSEAGSYTVELTVEDEGGNTDSTSREITVLSSSGDLPLPIHNFPNPASNRTTFVYQVPPQSTSATLRVFDLQGRLVHEKSLNTDQSQYRWNLSDVPEGLYYYRATARTESESTTSDVMKLVIRR